jgi:hypothetical protein
VKQRCLICVLVPDAQVKAMSLFQPTPQFQGMFS